MGEFADRTRVGVTDVSPPAGGERTAYSEPRSRLTVSLMSGTLAPETASRQWFGDCMGDVTPVSPGDNGQPKAPTGLIVTCSIVGAMVLAVVFAGMGNADETALGASTSTVPGVATIRPTARPVAPGPRGATTDRRPSPMAAVNAHGTTATDPRATDYKATDYKATDPTASGSGGARISERDLDRFVRHIGHRRGGS